MLLVHRIRFVSLVFALYSPDKLSLATLAHFSCVDERNNVFNLAAIALLLALSDTMCCVCVQMLASPASCLSLGLLDRSDRAPSRNNRPCPATRPVRISVCKRFWRSGATSGKMTHSVRLVRRFERQRHSGNGSPQTRFVTE